MAQVVFLAPCADVARLMAGPRSICRSARAVWGLLLDVSFGADFWDVVQDMANGEEELEKSIDTQRGDRWRTRKLAGRRAE